MLNILDAKGYAQYFSNYLVSGERFSVDELVTIKSEFTTLNDWSIALDPAGMTTSDNRNRGALMLGNAGNDALTGGTGDDLLAGSEGNDQLQGGVGNDSLLGGTGDDTLSGGAGVDYLEGGAGNDSYAVGDGDVIVDADGVGRVSLDGVALLGGRATGSGRWQDIGGNSYDPIDAGNGRQDLHIGVGSSDLAHREAQNDTHLNGIVDKRRSAA